MNKKKMILLAAALALLMILGIALGMGGQKSEADPTDPALETMAETTEATIPGVEKNIFDLPAEELEALLVTEAETKPAATVPTAPAGGASSDGNHSDGLYEPDDPEDSDVSPRPTEKKPDPTPATEKETEATQPDPQPQEDELTEYEKYQAMSPEDQYAFMQTFPDMESFLQWYSQVKAEYEAANPPIYVGNGKLDLKDYE